MADTLTTTQVAEQLGRSPQTVRRWADDGHLPHKVTPGGVREFSQADVDAFKDSMRRGGDAA